MPGTEHLSPEGASIVITLAPKSACTTDGRPAPRQRAINV